MGIPVLDTIFADLDKILQGLFGYKKTATPAVNAPKNQSPSASDDPLSPWFLPVKIPAVGPNKNPTTLTARPETIGNGNLAADRAQFKNLGYQAGGSGQSAVISAMDELAAFTARAE